MEEKRETLTLEETVNGKEDLAMVFYELEMARRVVEPLVKEAIHDIVNSYSTLATIHMLLSITEAKLSYYQKKYDFQIDYNDVFYPEDITNFLRFQSKETAAAGEDPSKATNRDPETE